MSAVIAVVVLPTGAGTRGFQLAEAIVASILLTAALVALFFERPRSRRDRSGPAPADGPLGGSDDTGSEPVDTASYDTTSSTAASARVVAADQRVR